MSVTRRSIFRVIGGSVLGFLGRLGRGPVPPDAVIQGASGAGMPSAIIRWPLVSSLPGTRTTWTYSASGRLLSETHADGSMTVYESDEQVTRDSPGPRPEPIRSSQTASASDQNAVAHNKPVVQGKHTRATERPVVQIVGPTDNWILEKLARRLAAKLPYAVFSPREPNRSAPAGIAYYVNYALYQGATSFIDVGFFTHRDDEQGFLERARSMDHCVCMSRLYADWLREQGVEHVTHIPMGFDFYRYRARLVVGVVGLLDHPRKGRQLVDRIKDLPFVEVLTTEGKIDEADLRDFYQRIDYVLIPATVEGGPMSLLEGLAIGRPIIAPSEVGMVPEFPDSPHILRYPVGDADAVTQVLKTCYEQKLERTRLVQDRTWDRWAEAHHELFNRLLKERGIRVPEPAPGFRFGMMSELEIPPNVDASRLEEAVDGAASHLFYGRYGEARSTIEQIILEFPFADKLLRAIPRA